MPKKKSKGPHSPELWDEVNYLKKHLEKLWEQAQGTSDRLQDIEVHVNLLTRLLTAICVEKLGMRIGVLKRIIKRIEKEVIQETQIHHLESLYKLPERSSEKPHKPKEGEDRWEDIS